MQRPRRFAAVILVIVLAWVPSRLEAQARDLDRAELIRRLELLENEVRELRAALEQTATSDPALAAVDRAVSEGVAAKSASETPPLSRLLGATTLSGSVDVDYGLNFNRPASRTSGLRAFDAPANQFSLNLLQLVLDRPPEAANSRLGYRVALGFGQAMTVVNSSDNGFAQYLKEAYFSYLASLGSGLTLDVGKFVTPLGAEVIDTKDDWNYSRGLLFTYAIPYYHFGLRMKYAFGDHYSLSGYVVNGWNDMLAINGGKTLGTTFAWTPTRKFSITQSYLAGPECAHSDAHWRQLSDTVIAYTPVDRLSLMLNYDYGRGDVPAGFSRPVFWTGLGAYARYAINPRYALAARYEYFDDHDGFTTGTRQHVNEFTTTLERVLAHRLITRLELRHDASSAPVFFKVSQPVQGQTTLSAGMVYILETHD